MGRTKEISVFIDESGSFDPSRDSSRHYMVCMVFHDQTTDISSNIAQLDHMLGDLGLAPSQSVHAGPLIRREKEYSALTREERRAIFTRMMAFIRNTPIQYQTFMVDKTLLGDNQVIHDPLLQQMTGFLLAHAAEFNRYEKLKVYYDNGQADLTKLLKESFAIFSSRTEFVPNVEPSNYRLFQVADMACTLELARSKLDSDMGLSESENSFFGGSKNLRKNYLKILDRKRFV